MVQCWYSFVYLTLLDPFEYEGKSHLFLKGTQKITKVRYIYTGQKNKGSFLSNRNLLLSKVCRDLRQLITLVCNNNDFGCG